MGCFPEPVHKCARTFAIFRFLDPPGILLLVAPGSLYWHIIKIQTYKHLDFKDPYLEKLFLVGLGGSKHSLLNFLPFVLVAPWPTTVDPPTFRPQIITYIGTNSNFPFKNFLYILTKKTPGGSKKGMFYTYISPYFIILTN